MMIGDGLPGMTLDGFEAAELARWHDGLAWTASDHEQHDLHEARAAQLRRWARSWAGKAGVALDLGA